MTLSKKAFRTIPIQNNFTPITPRHERGFYCPELWGTPKLTEEQNILSMSRRTIAIAAALSVLALGSLLISSCSNPLANNSFNSGLDKYEQGDYQGAIDDFTKAIEIHPQNADAYYNRGTTKGKLKDYQGAIADYNKAISFYPQSSIAYLNRGIAKSQLEDYQGAIADYNKVISIDPQNAVAYANRSILKEKQGDLNGSCSDGKKAASLGNNQNVRWLNSNNGAWCRNMQ